jgi:ABC-type phosphate transport system substrate-binding protein
MKKLSAYKLLNFAKFCFVLFFLLFAFTATSQVSSLTVISNPKGSPSSLKFSELRSIFMGEQQRWRGGTKVTIALMKTNTTAGKNTSIRVYGMSGDQLNKHWLALVFQGKAAAPNFFNSAIELENFVAQNPGAIGIVDQEPATNEVKTVMIEGKKSL